ncbi:MAG: 2-(1,2-epoxy-1,2-dihydrophenyl)acetyl-CoA isomerase [Proteobacteria bacterium]|nr:MAG: 2-(1,2-epoxy-1,2-dihydrophenyl)acetyl-CoA isomerase [Pseudomonadota bacterium]
MTDTLANLKTLELSVNGSVARIYLNRPDKLNAFNKQMHHELQSVLTEIGQRDDIRCVLLSGKGRGFCAGQDLAERQANDDKPLDLGDTLDQGFNRSIRLLKRIKAPIICAVNGVAAGAGANLALNCDIVVAKNSARFIQSFSSIGLIPDCNGTWILPKLVGLARAKAITMLATPVQAEQAEAWGMIYAAVRDEAFDDWVEARIQEIAQRPTKAMTHIKLLLDESYLNDFDGHLERERNVQRLCGLSHDFKEGVAAFNEKRKPQFKGH